MHFVCPLPPKCRISKMFSFSWELKWPQERTMLMQNFGGTNKEHYGLLWFWSGHLHSRVWLDWMSVFFFFLPDSVFWRRNGRERLSRVAQSGETLYQSSEVTRICTCCIDNNTLFTYLLFLCFVFQFYSIFYSSSCRFSGTHAHEPQPQLAQDSGIHTFFYATYNIKELQCSHEDITKLEE